ncbi:MAG: DUF2125 domain-containing protein [Shimia sp.]|nr:DUF2125 domain-containing protein [Shimia sp.]
MRFSQSYRMLASSAGMALLAGTAMADVTAQDVWGNWRAAMQEYGYTMSATEETSGGALMVKNLVLSMEIPEEETAVAITMAALTFTENGDGTVAISLSNNVPLTFDVKDGSEEVTATVTMSHDGLSTVASGTPEAITYTYDAAKIAMALSELVVDGETISDVVANGEITSVAGTSTISVGDAIMSQNAMTADQLTLLVKGNDPESGDKVDMNLSLAGLQASSEAALPPGSLASDDPAAMFVDGLNISGDFSMESSALAAAFEDGDGPGQLNMTTASGGVSLTMTDKLISYGGKITEVATYVMAPDVPLPLEVGFGELGYDFAIPLKASKEEQNFKLGLNFTEIDLSDFIWNLFDPGTILPRDAATLVLGLSGKATVFQDLVTLDEDMDEAPGELNALSLDTLELKAAGADISGSGSFTFDNTDMVSFDGFPRPEGALDVKINGINGLMDKLIKMGLLPEEQAMPARMMLGMFSVPVGDDQLTSRIEVNEQGHVLANGQRLK